MRVWHYGGAAAAGSAHRIARGSAGGSETWMKSSASSASDRDLLSPDHYARHGYPHAHWERLRREDPVHWVEDWGGDPYWAITRQREITAISRQPADFISSKGFSLFPYEDDVDTGQRQMIDMDPPEHQQYRSLVSKGFTPRALAPLAKQVDQIATQVLDRVASPMAAQDPYQLDEVCWFWTELRIVVRHGAEPWTDLLIKLMIKYPGLHFTTTGFAPKHYPKAIVNEHARSREGALRGALPDGSHPRAHHEGAA